MIPKTPARKIHTSIRVPCTEEEYAAIKRAAKLRGSPSLAAWLRERGACFGLADGMEALATVEDVKDAVRAFFESFDAQKAAHASWMAVEADESPEADAAWRAYRDARSVYEAARARAREVAR